jgi:hypothetical protein
MFITMSVGGVVITVIVAATIGAVAGHLAISKATATYRALRKGVVAKHEDIMAKHGKPQKQSGH